MVFVALYGNRVRILVNTRKIKGSVVSLMKKEDISFRLKKQGCPFFLRRKM